MSVPMEVTDRMDKTLIDEIKGRIIIHWNFREFTHVPEEILYYGRHIQELYLKFNLVKRLPEWIHELSVLKALHLDSNGISEISVNMCSLSSLTVLNMANNELTVLPPAIGQLKHLQVLDLKFNHIRTLPPEIINLKCLILLNIEGNELHQVHDSICYLRSLRELILDKNNITSLPRSIVYLPNLEYLSLSGNKLKYLPLVKFMSDPTILISDNPQLNYLSFDVGSQMTYLINSVMEENFWQFNIRGCFKEVGEMVGSSLVVPAFQTRIILPPELKQVYGHESNFIPSLFEMCFRSVYSTYFNIFEVRECSGKEEIDSLPSQLSEHLSKGPVVNCQCCACPVFTECIIWLFPRCLANSKEEDPQYFLSLMAFCSRSCSNSYYLSYSSMPQINWSLIHYLLAWRIE